MTSREFRSFADTQCASPDCEFCSDRPSGEGEALTAHAIQVLRLIPLASEIGTTMGNA